MKKMLAFVISALVVTACTDSEEITYSGTYVSASVKTSSVRMFTKTGEVKKTQVIKAFLPDEIGADFFILSDPPEVDREISVEFLQEGSVELLEYGNTSTLTRIDKNGIIYLEAPETSTIFLEGGQSFSFQNILKYKPLYADTTVLSAASGFQYAVDIKECIYLQPEGREIRMPIFSFYYKYHTLGGGGGSTAVRQNNTFNKSGIKKLGATDTLVVQESYIVFKKQ